MTENVVPIPIGDEAVVTDDAFAVVAPFDGRELARVPRCGASEVEMAAHAAARAAETPMPLSARTLILDGAASALRRPSVREHLARTIAAEAAKPLKTARVEAARVVDTFIFAAAAARERAGELVPLEASEAGDGKFGFVERVPIGIVGAITPFNFPANLVAHKLAPAIAAGCPVVLKPAEQAPLSAIELVRVLHDEAGLPPGWINIVTGYGDEAGAALVDHLDVAMITFTGSPPVGWAIRSAAPRKRVNVELGNNTPVIIDADGDWRTAAAKIATGGFSHAGQSCISVQRVYVHTQIAAGFCAALVAAVEALVVGDPLDENTDVSALIDTGARDRVVAWIDEARSTAAKVLAGGEVRDGILAPTVLEDVTNGMRVCRDEVFGPVVGVQTFDDFESALALANDTRYGLQAGVFTASLDKALRSAQALRFGGVIINEIPTWRADQMPYGGVGESGNTREGPAYAIEEMSERRLVVIQR